MSKTIKPFVKNNLIFIDDRGVFAPFIQNTEVSKVQKIKRIYYIYNFQKGTIRGFHFHEKEWKYFTIISGSAKFVVINPNKPKEKYEFVCSDKFSTTVTVPPGYANGWVSLENKTILLAASSSTLEESVKDDKRFDPNLWGDVWTVKAR